VWVVTDEIYEHLTYGSAEFHSLPVLVPEIADRCVVLNGVAKTYAMTGWRVGWMIGPDDVIKAASNLQSHSTSNVANVSQMAALAAVSGPLDAVVEMREAFDRRRRTIAEFEGLLRFRVAPPFAGTPVGLTGWRPPLVRPSPPPCGWSIGFIAVPRTCGRRPNQRLRPALPSTTLE